MRRPNIILAVALVATVGCDGNMSGAPDRREGGGGGNGVGDSARPTPSERTGATGDSGRGTLMDEDQQFVQKASMSNQMEITLGRLAGTRAQNPEVKQFGEQLAREHDAANRELQSSLTNMTATTDGGMGTMEGTQQRLQAVTGPEFDRMYLEEMVTHHQQDIVEFERASRSGNPQIRMFAERTLPALRQHHAQAIKLQQNSAASR